MLLALYRYYEETAEMWMSVYRDVDQMGAVAEVMKGFEDHLEVIRGDLLAEWTPYRSKGLRATLGHALRFSTWQSLHALGLGSRTMANLVSSWVAATAGK